MSLLGIAGPPHLRMLLAELEVVRLLRWQDQSPERPPSSSPPTVRLCAAEAHCLRLAAAFECCWALTPFAVDRRSRGVALAGSGLVLPLTHASAAVHRGDRARVF